MELLKLTVLLTLAATAVSRSEGLPRADVVQPSDVTNTPTSAGQNGDRFDEFDWRLCKAIHESDSGNVVISPISLKVVLAMLYEGASGKTAQEIANALNLERQETARALSRSKFSTILKSLKTSKDEYDIDIGTKIFIDKSAIPKPGYIRKLQMHYDAQIEQVDFSQPALAVKTINSWAESVTHGHIQHLVSEADAMESTVLLLLNAIYFKGLWENQFSENLTAPGIFYADSSKVISVPFMTTTASYQYLNVPELDSQIVRLPYKGNKFAMYVVVPNRVNGLQSLIQKINPFTLRQYLPNMYEMTIELILPKFEFDYTSSLGPILKELGIRSMFESDAELNDIAESANNMLVVSNVLQKAGLKVNEQGSIAYVATEAEVANKFGDARMILKVDRPFLFFIEDETTHTAVFVGKVVNPLQQKYETSTKKPLPASASTATPCTGNASGAQCTPSTSVNGSGDNLDRFGEQSPNQNTISQERFNYFDTELLREIGGKDNGNVVISSASIKTVLALLLEAAEGRTYNELRDMLRLPENHTATQEQLHRFQATLLRSRNANQAVILKAASRIFVSRDFSINPNYQRLIEEQYQSGITPMNFASPEVTAANINDWVKTFTNGLIPALIDPSMVQPDTHLILTNAIYFKGNWFQEFLPAATKIQCFYSDPSTCIPSYMMSQVGEHKHGYDISLDAQILQLPYEDQRYSMVIILPNKKNGIRQLTRDIPHKSVHTILRKLEKKDVIVSLPRFTIEHSVQLAPVLQTLGTHELFTDAANLPKLLSGNVRSKVSAIVHKARIEVNEKGTKAGAGTGAAVIPLMSAYNPAFTADHPFYFFICDEQEQTVLFSGRLNTPQEVSQADYNIMPVAVQPQPLSSSSQLSQPTAGRRPASTTISFAPQSKPYPSTGHENSPTHNGQRWSPIRTTV